ncbi:MAG: PEGA domain-containing protein [Deltaproteobacteria bacterium]|nr:PEGA domain-containing protein [Kofleriaceae bacterium]
MKLRGISLLGLVFSVAVALVGTAGPARAQSAEWKAAQAAFDQAQGAYLAGNYDDAAAGFRKAYEARRMAQFLFNVGAAYHMKGKKTNDPAAYQLAVDYYKKYVTEDPKAEDRKDVEKTIAVLDEELKRLAAAAPTGTDPTQPPPTPSEQVQALGEVKVRGLVVIESEPQGANIYINGKEKGPFAQTPWSGTMDGEFQYLVEKRGYKSKEGRTSADPSRLMVLQIVLSEEDYLGWLEIKSNVPGAEIFLDDKSVGAIGKTPFSGNFKPGKHTVWISADGYEESQHEIEVIAGETHEINSTLKGAPVGYLNVRGLGIEASEILVDGEVVCPRGPCRKPIKEGRRRVTVRRPGYKPYTTTIEVQAKTEISVKAMLAKKPGRGDAVVAYIFSAAFLGGGIYLGLEADKIHDTLRKEIDEGNPPIDQDDPRFQRGKYMAIGANAAYGLAGVIGLAAIYYTFRDKGAPSTATLDVRALALTPVIGPEYGGLSMELSW